MNNSLATAIPLPIGSVEAYEQAVYQFPMVSAEEERDLAERYQRDDDLQAARQLVISHLRFVVHVAKGYRGYGLPHADLVQEGNVGLMKAVKRFDPSVGVRLVSFAVHWIRAEIHEYILRNWRIVKVATTKAQRKLFFNLRSAKKRLGWLNQEEVGAVARDLGVPPETVLEMEKRMSAHDAAFDAQPDAEDDSDRVAPSGYLEDIRFDPASQVEKSEWEDHNSRQLQGALGTLDDRSRDILQKRWLADEKATLQDLATQYNVSAERIRQLEKGALKKLRKLIDV